MRFESSAGKQVLALVFLLLGLRAGADGAPPGAVVEGATPGAAPAPVIQLDLDGALERARRHSRPLMDRRDEVAAAEHRVLAARARMLPQLRLSGRLARVSYVEPAELELPFRLPNQPAPEPLVLGEAIQNQYGLRVSVEQPVFTGFSLLRGVDAARGAEALAPARRALEAADLEVVVEESYLGLWQAEELLQVARDSVRVLESHVTATENLRAQGELTRWEQDRVRARLAGARAQALQAESAVRLARLSLLQLLGLPDDQPIALVDVHTQVGGAVSSSAHEASAPPAGEAAPEDLISRALARRPELQVARAQAAVKRAQAGAAYAPLWPQVRIAASYGWERPNPRYFPPEDVTRDSWDAAALLQWTIFDFGASSHAAQALSLEARVAERAVAELEAKIPLDVARRHADTRAVAPRLEAARLAVTAAEAALTRAQTLCAEGQAACTGVLEAELELTRARSDRAQAVAGARLAAVRLKRATGGTRP